MDERKKKDGQDPGKKRKRMRDDVARRRDEAGAARRSSDQPDVDRLQARLGQRSLAHRRDVAPVASGSRRRYAR